MVKEQRIESTKRKTLTEIDLIKKEVEELRDKSNNNKYFYDGGKQKPKQGEGDISDKIVDVQKVTRSGFISLRDKDTQTSGYGGLGMNLSCNLVNTHDSTPLDREFHEMIEAGHFKTIKELRNENSQLKDVI